MSKRNYTHIQELLSEIRMMSEGGNTQREVAEHFGFKDEILRRCVSQNDIGGSE